MTPYVNIPTKAAQLILKKRFNHHKQVADELWLSAHAIEVKIENAFPIVNGVVEVIYVHTCSPLIYSLRMLFGRLHLFCRHGGKHRAGNH